MVKLDSQSSEEIEEIRNDVYYENWIKWRKEDEKQTKMIKNKIQNDEN